MLGAIAYGDCHRWSRFSVIESRSDPLRLVKRPQSKRGRFASLLNDLTGRRIMKETKLVHDTIGFKRAAIYVAVIALVLTFGISASANAMHIMEGYLPVGFCIAWGVLCIPFLVLGVIRIKKIASKHRRLLLILAMVGAYAFVLSALKIPSVTGSSSHPTGTGLGAMLFGPTPMAIVGLIVLLFQALLLAHGGLTTLGANTFSMGIVGPFISFGVYKLVTKAGLNKKIAIFLGACLGNLGTYCVTSIQLGMAYPSEVGGVMASVIEFMSVFALTQIPLAIIEGILAVVVIIGLETYAKPELREIGFLKSKSDNLEYADAQPKQAV